VTNDAMNACPKLYSECISGIVQGRINMMLHKVTNDDKIKYNTKLEIIDHTMKSSTKGLNKRDNSMNQAVHLKDYESINKA